MPINYIRSNPATEAFERVTARGENQRRYDKQEAERDRTRQQQEGVDQAIRGPLADIYAGKDAPEAKLIQGLSQAPGGGSAALQAHQSYNEQQEKDEAKRWDLFIDTLNTNPEIAARIRSVDPELSQLPESIITDAQQRAALASLKAEAAAMGITSDDPKRYEAFWTQRLPQALGAGSPMAQTFANLPAPQPKAPSTTGAKLVRTPDGNLTWAIPGQAIPAGAMPVPTGASAQPTQLERNVVFLTQPGPEGEPPIFGDRNAAAQFLMQAKANPMQLQSMATTLASAMLRNKFNPAPEDQQTAFNTAMKILQGLPIDDPDPTVPPPVGVPAPGVPQPGVNYAQPGGAPGVVQPGAQAPHGAPPVEGARQAPDGNWYVQQNGRWFRVEP